MYNATLVRERLEQIQEGLRRILRRFVHTDAIQANVSQLVCLANLENLNALFINEGMEQSERLKKLNRIAIEQMEILTSDRNLKRLEGGGG